MDGAPVTDGDRSSLQGAPDFTTSVHRFEPSRAAAKQETLGGALFAFLATPAILYGYGERDWRLLLGAALAAAAVVWMGFAVRTRSAWVDAIELSAEGVTLVRGGKRHTLAWTAVKSIRHETRGGERWLLVRHSGRDPLLIRDDGLTRDEARTLRELIPALHDAARQGADGAAR
jgi:hypothetical protein